MGSLEQARRELAELREHVRTSPPDEVVDELYEQWRGAWIRLGEVALDGAGPFDERVEAAIEGINAVGPTAEVARALFDRYGGPADVLAGDSRIEAACRILKRRIWDENGNPYEGPLAKQ